MDTPSFPVQVAIMALPERSLKRRFGSMRRALQSGLAITASGDSP